MAADCLFCKILRKEIPAEIVYENEAAVVIKDIQPCAPVHLLVIPKQHIESLNAIVPEQAAMLGQLQLAAQAAAVVAGTAQPGWRLISNVGPGGGQEVMHLHYHLIGGKILGWTPD
ncbi:MAG: HIT domain-containing protein [Syntrophomonadaceae bacterium]|nr:HIT domain-containing protein [Syntrophomonadaceae bacterium]